MASPGLKLPAVLQLRPYQQRWVEDTSRFKGAVKSARIGFSFGTGVESILDCISHPTTWTVLSASKAQSVEFVEQVQKNIQAIGATGEAFNEPFADDMGQTSITQTRIEFPNHSRIIALPANPRTARGYPGNAILDEFGHHEDSYSIWAAVTRQVALGHKLRVLSTPNGQQGKFFDLAHQFGLDQGVEPAECRASGHQPLFKDDWSWHWVDVHIAIADGCPISINEMRNLIQDEDTFAQEFLCVFLAAVGAWLPLELIANCEHDQATLNWPSGYVARGRLFGGIDVAREHDKTVLWLNEQLGDVAWTRLVLSMHATPFPEQQKQLEPWVKLTSRTAIDSTGMGIALYDYLNQSCGGRVMGVNFAGSNDEGVKMKTDLAIRLKRRMEKARLRIPHDAQVRQSLMAIKREATASGVKFDAPRIEVDSAVAGGGRRKVYSHADEFWALALAELSFEKGAGLSLDMVPSTDTTVASRMGGFAA